MDRSFLSQPDVIAASRQFVCVRLATYEDKDEGSFLRDFQVTRSGELENTVFAILSPDGRRQLARASRSANHTFGTAERMAQTMNRISGEHETKVLALEQHPELPKVANLRLAVNVAACDQQLLVVVVSKHEQTRRQLEERVTSLAWSDAFRGRFIYVTASEIQDAAGIEGRKSTAGVLVVQPDRFGQKGDVLAQVGAEATPDELTRCLKEGLSRFTREEKNFGNHVRAGQQKGILWETAIPVTDPMERQARERGRNAARRPPD
jgi:hypothetical protein